MDPVHTQSTQDEQTHTGLKRRDDSGKQRRSHQAITSSIGVFSRPPGVRWDPIGCSFELSLARERTHALRVSSRFKRSHTENDEETAVGMAVPSAALMCPRGTAALSDLAPELAEGALRYMPIRGSFLEALVQLGNTRRLVPWSYCVRAALTIALGQGLDAGALVTSTHNRGYTTLGTGS